MKRTILALFVLVTVLTACSSGGNELPELGSLFYPIYGYDRDTGECIGGPDSAAWNGDGGPILLEPVAGFYCFGWPKYQETTISLMEEHGFSWTLISYNGWGDVGLKGEIKSEDFKAAHGDIDAFLTRAEGKVKVALLVEPYVNVGGLDPASLTDVQKAQIRDSIWSELYQPHADAIFHFEGRPLLVQWFPMDLGQDDRFTIRTFGSSELPQEPLLDWNWYPDIEKYPEIISDDGFISFAPRFVDAFPPDLHNLREMDPLLEEGVYGKFWDIACENRDKIALVLIYGWNAYGELSVIETVVGGPDLLKQTQEGFERLLECR